MMKPEALLWKASQNMRTEVMSSFLLRSFCLYVVNVNSCQPHGCKKRFSIFKFGDLCHCCFYYVEFASAWRRLLGRSSMKLAVTMASCMYVWNFLNFGRCENSQKKNSLDDRGLVRKNDFRFWELFLFAIPNFPSHRAIKYEHLIIHSYIYSVFSNKPFDVTVFLHFNIWKCDNNKVIFHRGILCFIKIKFQWIFF